jgi:hypothetical protein
VQGGPPETTVASRKIDETTKERQGEEAGRIERERKYLYEIWLTSQAQEDLETYREIKRRVKKEMMNRTRHGKIIPRNRTSIGINRSKGGQRFYVKCERMRTPE